MNIRYYFKVRQEAQLHSLFSILLFPDKMNGQHCEDILRVIPDDELTDLAEFYKEDIRAPYVYSFIKTVQIWKMKAPEKRYMTFYSIEGEWRKSGTFFALVEVYL